MIVSESSRGRRVVGRLDRGQDLYPALLAVCRERGVRTAELRGLGSFEIAELAEFDQAARAWKPGRVVSGGFEVLNLTGNVSERDGQLAVHAHVTLMRDRDSGIEVFGGHLVSARVYAFEFVIEALDDVILRRAPDESTGLVLWREAISTTPVAVPVAVPAPVAAPAPAPAPAPASPTWSDVARASKPAPAPADPDDPADDEVVSPGDFIDHPAFGRCEVQRIEGEEFVHARLKSGNLVRLSLEVLRLRMTGRDGQRKVFRARVER